MVDLLVTLYRLNPWRPHCTFRRHAWTCRLAGPVASTRCYKSDTRAAARAGE